MAFGRSDDAKGDTDSSSALRPLSGGQKPIAFLGQGSKVVGTLNFSGPVELDGYIEGELNADKLTIGESAVINAKINGAEIIVKGTVNGDIVATKRLLLQKPAKVVGNITSTNLSIEEGVLFEGQCSMNSAQTKSATPRVVSEKVAASS